MTAKRANWAGNVTFGAVRFHRPASLPELQRLVARGRRVRALGSGHSFNRIADTPGDLVSVAGLPRLIEIDSDHGTVTISAGLRYGDVAVALNRAGRALRNLGSLPHISVAGSCATGTHGSGDTNGSLAASVSALEMVTADGDLVTVSRNTDPGRFPGAVTGLGALGIVTRLTLRTVPSFRVRQYVYEDLPLEQVSERFDEIFASGYSVSLFTDWRAPRIRQAWLKRRAGAGGSGDADDTAGVGESGVGESGVGESGVGESGVGESGAGESGAGESGAGESGAGESPGLAPRWMGGRLADGPRNPVPGMPAENCTTQLGVPGPWHERLPHFRLEFTPSAGEELQSEYLLPRARAAEALAAMAPIADRLAPVLQIAEIRTVAADDLWLSPSYGRATVAFHFTWIKDWAAVSPVLAVLEERLAPLGARPHWGKLFHTSPAAMRGLYERMDDFHGLMRHYDPAGKFRNDLLDRYFPPASS